MMNFDPTQPLLDLTVHDGKPVFRLEQPHLACPCENGLLDRALWLNEPAKCTCARQTDDFLYTLHEDHCNSLPCPFCPAENHATDV